MTLIWAEGEHSASFEVLRQDWTSGKIITKLGADLSFGHSELCKLNHFAFYSIVYWTLSNCLITSLITSLSGCLHNNKKWTTNWTQLQWGKKNQKKPCFLEFHCPSNFQFSLKSCRLSSLTRSINAMSIWVNPSLFYPLTKRYLDFVGNGYQEISFSFDHWPRLTSMWPKVPQCSSSFQNIFQTSLRPCKLFYNFS